MPVRKKIKFTKSYRWLYSVLGIAIIIFGFLDYNSYKKEYSQLESIEINLRDAFENITGNRNRADFSFYDMSYKARFIVLNSTLSKVSRDYVFNLKKGDKLKIKIDKSDLEYINKDEDIVVYGIKFRNLHLLSEYGYSKRRSDRSNRVDVLIIFIGYLIFLRGLNISDGQKLLLFVFGAITAYVYIDFFL
jgi:hypothetical protein